MRQITYNFMAGLSGLAAGIWPAAPTLQEDAPKTAMSASGLPPLAAAPGPVETRRPGLWRSFSSSWQTVSHKISQAKNFFSNHYDESTLPLRLVGGAFALHDLTHTPA